MSSPLKIPKTFNKLENMCDSLWMVDKRAKSLELNMWKISILFEEDHNFGVEGIEKEVGTLKEKISEVVIEFGSILVAFDKQQT